MTTETKLADCPFCGASGPNHGYGFTGESYGIVDCECGGAMQIMPGSEADAIAAWNQRTAKTYEQGLEDAAQCVEHGMHLNWSFQQTAYAIRALAKRDV